jgi:hypothetical protein
LRRELYWLHTGMIHVWLFGDQEYCEATARAAAELVRPRD